MKKVVSLRKKISASALLMVAVLFLSSLFTMLIDTSKAGVSKSPVPNKGYELIDADINDYDIDGKLKANVISSSKEVSKDQQVLAIIEVDDNSLGDNYIQYANSKYGSLSEYVNSDVAQGYALNMVSRQNALYNNLSQKYEMTHKYSYTTFFNGFSAVVRYGDIEALEKENKVKNVVISATYAAPEISPASSEEVATNIVKINAETGIYDTSDSDYKGHGTIVAVLDTGLDHEHQAFANKGPYRDIENNGKYYIDDIAQILESNDDFRAKQTSVGLSARDVYISEKIPYAYDYADNDAEVFPTNFHGTHVAGIIAGHDDEIKGAAVGAQLAIMKVFSDKDGGAENANIWAAVEDCVYLGVDVINMSLGTTGGFARDKDHNWSIVVYDMVLKAGINLICAAGNDFSSGLGSQSGLNLTAHPESSTISQPGSFNAALSVASIEGVKTPYLVAYDGKTDKNGPVNGLPLYYTSPSDNNGEELEFMERLLADPSIPGTTTRKEIDYVVIDGLGQNADYSGLNVKGKIVVVKRGIDSFVDKIKIATENGAIGVIVRNNVSGIIRMSLGTEKLIPACSVVMEVGDELYNRNKAKIASGQTGGGKIILDNSNRAGPFMSEFSSWGPLPNLELKPEITAHGGKIKSADIGGDYETTSGTSMAAPNFAGIVALLRQHVIANAETTFGIDPTDTEAVRSIVNQLFMSTATIAVNEKSDPYSPRKQGAGLADLGKAEKTSCYLYVEKYDELLKKNVVYDKTKLSIGDDPNRTGVYELEFFLKNTSNSSYTYNLSTTIMTEGVSVDGRAVTEVPVLLNESSTDVKVSNGSYNKSKKTVTVEGKKAAKITVTLKLSKADKKYLDENFENGMYVEGFVQLTPTLGGNSVPLNIPYLAFYGDWSDAPLFDKTVYEVSPDEINDNLQEHEKNKAYVKPVTPYGQAARDQGNRVVEYFFPLGMQIYEVADQFNKVPTEIEKTALSLSDDGIFMLYGVGGFLRPARTVDVKIVNSYTGQVMWDKKYQNARKATSSMLGMIEFDDDLDLRTLLSDSGVGFVEGGKYSVQLEAFLDWGDGETYGTNNVFAFDFYVDSVAPQIIDVNFRLEKNSRAEEPKRYLDFEIFDSHYTSALDVQYYDPNLGTFTTVFGSGVMPVRGNRGGVSRASVEVTKVWDYIVESDYELMVMTADYAWNQSYQYLKIGGLYNPIEEISFLEQYATTPLNLKTNEEYNLYRLLNLKGARDSDRLPWDEDFVWTSSNESVVTIHEGKVVALAPTTSGYVTIRVRSDRDPSKQAELLINVSEQKVNENVNKVNPTKVELSQKYLNMVTGAKYELEAKVSPHREAITDMYRIAWTSNSYNPAKDIKDVDGLTEYDKTGEEYTKVVVYDPNVKPGHPEYPKIVTPDKFDKDGNLIPTYDPNYYLYSTKATVIVGGIYEEKLEGYKRPTITATVELSSDGGETWVAQRIIDRCEITVEQTFVVSFHTLTAYNGAQEHVIVPSQELGIESIGEYAFSSNLDIKEVTIEEGVRAILGSAFSYCNNIEYLNLPNSLISIGEWAFSGRNPKNGAETTDNDLKEVRFPAEGVRKLRSIGDRAFALNEKLTKIDLSTVTSIGNTAFLGCSSLEDIDLSHCKTLAMGAFIQCTSLKTIIFAEGVEIGDYAFTECAALSALEIPASRIGEGAFSRCGQYNQKTAAYEGLPSVTFTGDGPLYIGDMAFLYCYNLSIVEFGDAQVTNIGNAAFALAIFLGEITLPGSLKNIGMGAFETCDALVTVNIHKDLDFEKLQPNMTFLNCDKISTIRIVDDNKMVAESNYIEIHNNVVYKKGDLSRILFAASNTDISSLSFAGVEYIAPYAFSGNKTIRTLDLTGVKEIGDGAFSNCTYETTNQSGQVTGRGGLTSVIYSSSLTKIGASAFGGNTYLTKFEYTAGDNIDNSSLTYLGEGAFSGTAITSIVLPKGITTIRNNTFDGCTSLKTLTAKGTITSIGDYAFAAANNLISIDLSEVSYIGEGAFIGCTNLGSVDLDKVEKIGISAFAGCTKLELDSLDSVTEIGSYAFGNCPAITDMSLPNATHIGAYAFSATLHNPIFTEAPEAGSYDGRSASQKIANRTTISNANLKTVSMPVVEHIFEGAFRYTELEEVELPQTLKTVMPFAFSNCSLLKSITVANGNKNFFDDDGVLYGYMPKAYPVFDSNGKMSGYSDNSLVLLAYPTKREAGEKSITSGGSEVTYKFYQVRKGTVKIEAGAFIGSDLQYVDLPEQTAVIGHQAFFGCEELRRIDFHSYYAPALETTVTISAKQTIWAEWPPAYNYSIIVEVTPYYGNFVFEIAKKNIKTSDLDSPSNQTQTQLSDIELYRPANSAGFDSYLYTLFFKDNFTVLTEFVLTPTTEAFVKGVWELASLENMDWHRDKETVEKLFITRNLLTEDQLKFVDDSVLAKIADAKTWIENNEPQPQEPTSNLLLIVLLVVGGVLVLAGGGVAAFLIIRKKKAGNSAK